jgi:hypothetical protein
MGDRLVLCVACSRHMKASEACCPFCGGTIARVSTGEPFRRMAAAAAVAAGVTTLAAACSTPSASTFYGIAGIADPAPEGGTDGSADSPSVVGFYGIANPVPEDAAAPTDAPSEASDAATVDEREDG